VLIAREVWYLDATAKKIVNELQSVERQIRALQTRASSLKDALAVAGLRPDNEDTIFSSGYEAGYISEQPFVHMSLVDSCKRVLLDYKPTPLLKSQIEYLVRVGGCKFDTEDSKNSVGTTLLRLAENEFCKVERNRGPEGNKYWVEGIASKTDSK
jgi:hypothetical protein